MKDSVLITGAGSLGREFIKLLHKDYDLTVIDNCEWTIAELEREYPDVDFILDDYVNNDCYYDYVIHTAAYKHLPLGEKHPTAFIDNNIVKFQKFLENGPGRDILFISTDKAVEPCSTYGYTKAIGEALAKRYDCAIARCGNILNSSGSVIPVWEAAIAEGKPIPITSEKMVRYFIEAEEAAKQMWRGFLEGKKLIIPDCERVTIADLLLKTLEKHGLTYADVEINYIGVRPNEKLEEKLTWEGENA